MCRLRTLLKLVGIPGTLGGALLCGLSVAGNPPLPPPPPDATGLLAPQGLTPDGGIQQVQDQQPLAVPSAQPVAPAAAAPLPSLGGGSRNPFGSPGGSGPSAGPAAPAAEGGGAAVQPPTAAPSVSQVQSASAPAASTVSGVESQTRASTDLGDLLGKSLSSVGVEVQRRNPIITDPRVRAYHVGELFTVADGAFYFPAREDLDTIVSKIDSTLIRDVVIVKGPYSVRYGPGIAFLDVETLGSPRYQDGFEVHGSTSAQYKTNGDQWHGRQAVWGGDSDYGFRLGYDLMAGADYRVGGTSQKLPTAYSAQNIDGAFGVDLSPDSSLEFRALRQDMHSVDLPGEVFDIGHAYTDAATARYTLKNQEYFNRLTVDTWFNQTRFDGNNFSPAKQFQLFAPTTGPAPFFGITDGNVQSIGYRAAVTWGEDKHFQFTAGSDFQYLTNRLAEYDTISTRTFIFPIPRSYLADPGVFADAVLPLLDNRLTFKAGVRADWATTDISSLPADQQAELATLDPLGYSGPFGRTFNLWAAYLSAEWKMTDHWTLLSGAGNAERPPTLTELYAGGPFLSLYQNHLFNSGLTSVYGNKQLDPEQVRQLDLALRADYDTFRFGLSGFYAWIHDYITYQVEAPPPPLVGGNGVAFVNTDRAALSGFELYAEWDVLEWLTPFVTMEYVEGRDYTRDHRGLSLPNGTPNTPSAIPPGSLSPQEPLPDIPPLEARLGVRLHDPRKTPRWGVEFLAHMVAAQNRIAQSLGEEPTPGFTIFNLRSYWQVRKALMLTAGVENIGNRLYQETLDSRLGLGVFQPGVNFYFGAQLTY